MEAIAEKPWYRRISWISVVNLVLLTLGVLGFWRDRIVVNEAKLEQQTVTLGEIKSDVSATRDLVQKTSTDVEVLKESQKNIQTRVDDLGRRVGDLEDGRKDIDERFRVIENRRR